MELRKLRIEKKWSGLLVAMVALNGAPAWADDSSGGLFSSFASEATQAFTSFFKSFQSSGQASGQSLDQSSGPSAAVSTADNNPSPIAAPAPTASSSTQSGPVSSLFRSSADNRASANLSAASASVQRSAAQAAAPGLPVVRDSAVTIPGAVPSGARWMEAVTIKAGVSGQNVAIVAVDPGTPVPTIYLPDGQGEYTVNVFFSQSADTSYTQGFKYFNSAHVRNEDTRDVAFLLPSLKIQSDSREVTQLSSALVQGLSSDREKAMAFHDWLTREVTYDVDGASNGSYRQRRQDAIATIDSKLAVCEGYANTFAALARASGIRAKVVIGRLIGSSDRYRSKQDVCDDNSRELHAWNEVYADNRWITVDATLDAGSEDGMTGKFKRTPNNHELFDPSPSYFEMTHVKCYEDHQ